MPSLNIFDEADDRARAQRSYFGLGHYEVKDFDGNAQRALVRPVESDTQSTEERSSDEGVEAIVPHPGDAMALEEGEEVVCGWLINGLLVVLGFLPRGEYTPDVEEGERVVGNGNTAIRFKPDSTVVVEADTVELAGEGGAKVARKGDAITVDGPDATTGEIAEGSDNAFST